jgi:Uma2 family endonuclease
MILLWRRFLLYSCTNTSHTTLCTALWAGNRLAKAPIANPTPSYYHAPPTAKQSFNSVWTKPAPIDFLARRWQNQAMTISDEYFYGRRQITRYDKTGQPIYTWLPLERADFLNPQEGDEFAHGPRHTTDLQMLRRALRFVHRFNPSTVVLSNLTIRWPQPDLPAPAPDLAVAFGVSQPRDGGYLFDVAAENAEVRFVLEITSPRLADIDLVDKRIIYARAGVEEYFIVHAVEGVAASDAYYSIYAYRLTDGVYAPILPDAEGHFLSAVNRLRFTLAERASSVLVIDDRTGQPVQPDPQYDEPIVVTEAEATFRAQSIASQLDFLRPE